jgi:uncharacterized protein with HEPN domain
VSREPSLYLADIEESCRLILQYTGGMTADQFRADRKTVDAVLRNLEVIGEAVKHLPASSRAQRADMDWRRIAGFRDILIHAYFGVDLDIIWDVVTNKIPALLAAVTDLQRQAVPKR